MEVITIGLIDKTAHTTIKSTKAIAKGSQSLVKNSASTGTNMLVKYSPDVYDKHQEMTSGITKQMVGNSIMVVRAGYRSSKNLYSAGAASLRSFSKHRIKKIDRKLAKSNTANDFFELQRSRKRWEVTRDVMNKKAKNARRNGLHPVSSARRIVSNQSRKAINVVSNKDDYATKTTGRFLKGAWGTTKYARKFFTASKTIIQMIISSILAFLTSMPAMIMTIVSMLPIFIALIVAFCIFFNAFNSAFEGRIGALAGKLEDLNDIYEIDFNPGEILAISDVLEWTTPDGEDYEILCSLMLDQKIGNKLTFEEMIDNVFNKYNPSKWVASETSNWELYYEGWHKVNATTANTGWHYYSNEGWDISIIAGGVDKKNISRSNLWGIHPVFARTDLNVKKEYGTVEKIEALKQKAREAVSINTEKYNEYLTTIVIGNNGHGGNTGAVDIEANLYSMYYNSYMSPFWNGEFVGQCTWYCWGRANEVNTGKNTALPTGNAGTWLYTADKNGFSIGEQPSTNSIAVFASGNGYGHVAFVESYDGTTIKLSEANVTNGTVPYPNTNINVASEHMGTWTGTLSELENRWGQKLLGFIYLYK